MCCFFVFQPNQSLIGRKGQILIFILVTLQVKTFAPKHFTGVDEKSEIDILKDLE
jgi:hypothetical protein